MRAKTFVQPVVSHLGGRESAFEKLDKAINDLGDIVIHQLKDTEYPVTPKGDQVRIIARVVIYEERKNKTKGG